MITISLTYGETEVLYGIVGKERIAIQQILARYESIDVDKVLLRGHLEKLDMLKTIIGQAIDVE